VDVSKTEEKTIVKIETEQTRIVDGVKRLASLFNFQTDVPFKIEKDGARSIVTMELTKWIFCDCDFKKNKQLPELTEEGTEDEEDEELFKKIFSNGTDPCSEGTDEAESSMILIKEFFELSDAEESFLERKASIRRSQHSREDSDQSKNLIEPTSSFVSETYITEPVKFEEDEELQHLESHLNNSISRILSKIRKIKKSSNKKRTTMSLSQ